MLTMDFEKANAARDKLELEKKEIYERMKLAREAKAKFDMEFSKSKIRK